MSTMTCKDVLNFLTQLSDIDKKKNLFIQYNDRLYVPNPFLTASVTECYELYEDYRESISVGEFSAKLDYMIESRYKNAVDLPLIFVLSTMFRLPLTTIEIGYKIILK